jgi:ketosteroid isomerase-like protein
MGAIEVARKVSDDFNKHDLDALAESCAEDVAFIDMATGETCEGPAGFRAYCERWLTAMPDAQVEVLSATGSDDVVYLEFVGRGTQSGPLAIPGGGAIPASSKPVEISFCEAVRTLEDKVVSARLYYDALTMLRQIGILPSLAPEEPVPEPTQPEP